MGKQDNSNSNNVLPYNFVSFGNPENINRGEYKPGKLSGKLLCTLTNISPFFTGGNKKEKILSGDKIHNEIDFLHDSTNYLIPGSTIKGEIKNIVEVITTSCVKNIIETEMPDANKKKKQNGPITFEIPKEFQPCVKKGHLCFACRLFGTTGDTSKKDNNKLDSTKNSLSLRGRVFFTDAILNRKKAQIKSTYIPVNKLGEPRKTATKFYCEKDSNILKGRKFYWHHRDNIILDNRDKSNYRENFISKKIDNQNSSIKFLLPRNSFTFEVNFQHLNEEELGVLIYALQLEKEMAHKIGMGKPLGLGSCIIKIDKLLLENPDKYSSFTSSYTEIDPDIYNQVCMDRYINIPERKEIQELKTILNINSITGNKKFSYSIGGTLATILEEIDK